MRVGIKAKQVIYVTSIVGAVVVVLSLMHLARLAQVSLEESKSQADLVANAIYQRSTAVVQNARGNPADALRADPGLRSILEASLYSKTVTFGAIADTAGFAVVHTDPNRQGLPLQGAANFDELLARRPLMQLRANYSDQGRNLELRKPQLLDRGAILNGAGGATDFGSIRIGVSTLLIRGDLDASLWPGFVTALIALTVSIAAATVLAQLLLRPIHVIRSGVTGPGGGEVGRRPG